MRSTAKRLRQLAALASAVAGIADAIHHLASALLSCRDTLKNLSR